MTGAGEATTRSVRLTADRRLEMGDALREPLGPDDVRLAVAYSGICGSDLHLVYDVDPVPRGLVPGHEVSGRVVEIGAAVTDRAVGDRVALFPIAACGVCRACATGDGICYAGVVAGPGLGRPGGFADELTVPASMVVPLPDEVDDRTGALVEPTAVAVRAVARSGVDVSSVVGVLGAGPVGVMVVAVLLARGCTRVVVVEPNEARREFVARTFPTVTVVGDVSTVEGSEGFDALLDCSGHPAALVGALPRARAGAQAVVVGMPTAPSSLHLALFAVQEMHLTGSLAYSRDDFAEAIGHLGAGRIPVEHLVTAVLPLTAADDALRDLHSGSTQQVKVLLSPTP